MKQLHRTRQTIARLVARLRQEFQYQTADVDEPAKKLRPSTPVATLATVSMILVLVSVPALILLRTFSSRDGFTELILFGKKFKDTQLPEVQRIDPPTRSDWGSDGQFYAQIALAPSLNNRDLGTALDSPRYRARRIGLPFLAYCLGFGKPRLILQVYAVLNVVFWLILLALLYRSTGFRQPRDFFMTTALLWSTGTLLSVARSLTDLPATVVSLWPVLVNPNWIVAASLFGAAAMFKETSIVSSVLCVWRVWERQKGPHKYLRLVLSYAIAIVPISIWILYVHHKMAGGRALGTLNFTLPLQGIFHKLNLSLTRFIQESSHATGFDYLELLFELLAPMSLIVQSLYLLSRPRMTSQTWRLGVGFVVLLFFLGNNFWPHQYAYTRAVLPLTFSFNLLLHQRARGTAFGVWYVLGNIGLTCMAVRILLLNCLP